MKIAICDDSPSDRSTLYDTLCGSLISCNVQAELIRFDCGEAMMAALQNETYPINFLDIYMKGVSGIMLARHIRAQSDEAAIVFTTSSAEHMTEGFEVGAAHYLLKPYTQAGVDAALTRCMRQVGGFERHVELLVNRQVQKVLLHDVLYAESRDKSCIIHTKDGELRPYLRLDELEGLLIDSRFLRCHRSFLLNMDYAVGVQGGDFIMTDDARIPIRREQRVQMRERFEDYCFDKSRRRP